MQVDANRLPHVIALTHDSKFENEGKANTSSISSFLDRVIDSTALSHHQHSDKNTPEQFSRAGSGGGVGNRKGKEARNLRRTRWSFANTPKDEFVNMLEQEESKESRKAIEVGMAAPDGGDAPGVEEGDCRTASTGGTSAAVSEEGEEEDHGENDEVSDLRASGMSFIPRVQSSAEDSVKSRSPGIMPSGLGSPGIRPKPKAPPEWQSDFGVSGGFTTFPEHDSSPCAPTTLEEDNLNLFYQHTGDVRVLLFTAMESIPVLWSRLAELHGGGASDHGGAKCSFWAVKADNEAVMSHFKVHTPSRAQSWTKHAFRSLEWHHDEAFVPRPSPRRSIRSEQFNPSAQGWRALYAIP